MTTQPRPYLGFGLGLRAQHLGEILQGLAISDTAEMRPPAVDWFEIISENFMVAGGKPRRNLESVRQRYPIVMHGVSLSIGGSDPIDQDYLRKLKQLALEIEPVWISDHLCWTGIEGINSHDLLPLPYSQAAIEHVVARVNQVQEFLGREILLENLSSYVEFSGSVMPEWQFVAEIAQRSGCRLLLDVNNIQVSAHNHGFNPLDYLAGIPIDRVWQIHLAGHSAHGEYVIDTHDHAVPNSVWALYGAAVRRFGAVSTMIERDDHIPPLAELLTELAQARAVHTQAIAAR